jgi:hypothetical protein
VVGPERGAAYRGSDEEARPNTTIASFGLPLQFHPAGNALIWEDGNGCLHKIPYRRDNWGPSAPFAGACGHTITYTPNGIATIDWQPRRPGLHIHGLVDGTDREVLSERLFEQIPSHTPDGRGIVAVTSENGHKVLRYLPIDVPLANVANAWMYTENAGDQQRLVRDRGLFRPLPQDEQLYRLYDSESYACGEPDARVPTRPYFVTTDLFWELYGAAFDGLFMILEREQAIRAFARFVTAADDDLRAHHAGSPIARAFAAARAVFDGLRLFHAARPLHKRCAAALFRRRPLSRRAAADRRRRRAAAQPRCGGRQGGGRMDRGLPAVRCRVQARSCLARRCFA